MPWIAAMDNETLHYSCLSRRTMQRQTGPRRFLSDSKFINLDGRTRENKNKVTLACPSHRQTKHGTQTKRPHTRQPGAPRRQTTPIGRTAAEPWRIGHGSVSNTCLAFINNSKLNIRNQRSSQQQDSKHSSTYISS